VNLECVSKLSEFDSEDTNYTVTYGLRISVGVWCILVAIVGIFGNLLTLFALPYDYKQRYKNGCSNSETWNTSTIFIINLARIDLFFCIFCMPTFIIPLLTQRPIPMICHGKILFAVLSDILRFILL
jgi:hypothetical protein